MKKPEQIGIDIGPTEKIKTEMFSYTSDGDNNTDDNFQHDFEDDYHGQLSPTLSTRTNSSETEEIAVETARKRKRKSTTTSSLTTNKIKGNKYLIIEDKNLSKVPPPIKSGPNGTASYGYFLSKRIINPDNGCHKCRICSREYLQYRNFWTHFKSDHIKVSYTCPVTDCCKSFSLKSSYTRHYLVLHLDLRQRQQCQHCQKTFFYKVNLRKQVRMFHK